MTTAPQRRTSCLGLILVFVAVPIAAIVIAYFTRGFDPDRYKSGEDSTMACIMAENFVKRELRAPSTAKFAPIRDCNTSQRGRIWVVRSYVDAQNGFGAMIRNDYGVELVYRPATDQWELVSILIVPR